MSGFLHVLSGEVRPIVTALRALIRKTVPDAVESLLWGGLSYHRPHVGGRVKGAVCQIGVKGGKVRLDFIHGVRLADPHRLLRGTRLSKRHVVVDGVDGARRRELAELLREAANVDFARPILLPSVGERRRARQSDVRALDRALVRAWRSAMAGKGRTAAEVLARLRRRRSRPRVKRQGSE